MILDTGSLEAEMTDRMWVSVLLFGDQQRLISRVGNVIVLNTDGVNGELERNPQTLPRRAAYGLMVCSLCNNASISKGEDGAWVPVGDPTEVCY